jgi:hypothetical protein
MQNGQAPFAPPLVRQMPASSLDLIALADQYRLNKPFYPIHEAFEILDVGETVGWQLIRTGQLQVIRITTKNLIVPSTSLAQLIHARQQAPPEQKRARGNAIAKRQRKATS